MNSRGVVEGVFRPDFDYCLSEAFPWFYLTFTHSPLSQKKNPPSPKMEAFASPPPWLDAPALFFSLLSLLLTLIFLAPLPSIHSQFHVGVDVYIEVSANEISKFAFDEEEVSFGTPVQQFDGSLGHLSQRRFSGLVPISFVTHV